MPHSTTESENRLSGSRLLLIDDEQRLLEILKLFLENENMQVDVADTLTEGYRKLNEHPAYYYDALICDQNLPDGDGAELLNSVQSNQPGVVTILMSGYLSDTRRLTQFDRQLQKPVTLKALRQALIDCLNAQDKERSDTLV